MEKKKKRKGGDGKKNILQGPLWCGGALGFFALSRTNGVRGRWCWSWGGVGVCSGPSRRVPGVAF